MHDRIIGALETCCRQGEMLRIQNKHVDWSQRQIVIPGAHAKESENRRIPFDPHGRLAPISQKACDAGTVRVRHRFTGRRIPGQPQDTRHQ
jgi:integrase